MPKLYIPKEHFWENVSIRILLTVIVTAVIVALLPHDSETTFDYTPGRPWMLNQLIADSDVPLYKSEEVLKEERDSLLAGFEPYYNIVESVGESQVAKFNANYAGGIPDVPKGYLRFISARLERAYEIGIIDDATGLKAAQDTTMHIRAISGNEATSVQVSHLLTVRQAYDWLFNNPVIQKYRPQLEACDLTNYLKANIIYDEDRTTTERNDLLGTIPVASGMIYSGQEIIGRGDIVTPEKEKAIKAYIKERQQRTQTDTELFTTYGGQAIYVFIMIAMFTLYLMLYRRDYFEKPRSIAMLYIFLAIMPVMVSIVMKHHFYTVYVLPMAMAPMFVRIFMDSRTAFLTHTIIVLVSALAVQKQFDFIAVELAGGLTAIYILRQLEHRSQVFVAAIMVSMIKFLLYFAIQLIQTRNDFMFDLSMVYHFIANAVFLLLTYPLMFIVEKVFGFTSAVTLFELSDTNRPLLRRLSEVAPGTFQHSIMVGNLAASVASKVGAKALLVRVGALYHDIGKMRHPVFFTENQNGVNPHKRISETESAQVVISHVTEGLRQAEMANLPSVIQDFIRTHHGTGMARYFYVQYKNNHPDEDVDDELFTYPGPNPFTREQAILMMADTVEAASRSLKEYTEESIAALVNRLIDGQVQQGYFTDCPITFRDIKTAKEVLIERLKSIYHTRIAYPELKDKV